LGEGRENRPRSRHCESALTGRESGHPPKPVQTATLREKECGHAPHFFCGAFFIGSAFFGDRKETIRVTSKRKIASAATGRARSLALGPLVLALLLLSLLPASAAATQSPAPAASQPATLAVTDEAGRAVRVPQPVRRIVSLAPNLTETIFALGLGGILVGDTDYCDYPSEALKKPHVGGPINPNFEEIMALHPDLVLATRSINRLATVEALERLGVAVYVTDPRTVEQVIASNERLGHLLGAGEQAATVSAALRDRLNRLRQRLAGAEPRSVFFVTWVDPLISVGRDNFLADALHLAGARSVISTPQDWPNVSLEEVLRQQPEYLIFSSNEPEQIQRQLGELRSRPGWQGLEALRQNRIVILSEAFSRPAPRLLDTIEQLARALHPDRFTAALFGTAPFANGRFAIRPRFQANPASFSAATGAAAPPAGAL
jgi:iron complex transport system substrate-binding protein